MNAENMVEGFPEDHIINERFVVMGKPFGGGGMGLVYYGHPCHNSRRKVIIKTLRKEARESAYTLKHFDQEAEALERINHDGVIKVIDHGVDGATRLPFIVMEFAKGKTLTEVINRGPMDFKKCAHLVKEIAYALSAAHAVDVYHRDLKPDNIIVDENAPEPDRIKLIDFGIAKVQSSNIGKTTIGSVLVGTLEYASPELLDTHQTIEGEVFCLAVVAYQMLTQKLAFPLTEDRDSGKKVEQLRRLHREGAKSPKLWRPRLPGGVEKVFEKALALDPAKRYQTPIEFADALASALAGKEPDQRKVSYALPSRSRRALWKLLPLLAIAGLLCLLYYVFVRQPPAGAAPPMRKYTSQPRRDGQGATAKRRPASFNFEYPDGWELRNSTKEDFVAAGRFVGEMPVEQIHVGWYKEAFKDQQKLRESAGRELAKMIKNYEPTSPWEADPEQHLKGRRCVQFRGAGRSGSVSVWARALFFEDGLRVIAVATSMSTEVKSDGDVGSKGELARVLPSLSITPGQK